MPYYYHHDRPMIRVLFEFTKTLSTFEMVMKRFEFWALIAFHIVLIVLVRIGLIEVGEVSRLSWKVIGAGQFFMTLYITFFNSYCYERYLKMYMGCCGVLNILYDLVQELMIFLQGSNLSKARTSIVKYVLAMVFVFYLGIVLGKITDDGWREIIQKGLLTEDEAEQLRRYPSRAYNTTIVLAVWIVKIIDQSLLDDSCWVPHSIGVAERRNRLTKHIEQMLKLFNEVGIDVSLPVAYPYYHLNNIIVGLNLFLFMAAASLHGTYLSIFPVAGACVFFLGLREISSYMLDPYTSEDDIDFPVRVFMTSAYEAAIALLYCFHEQSTLSAKYMLESPLGDHANHLTDLQLRYKIASERIYSSLPATLPFAWKKVLPMQVMMNSSLETAPIESVLKMLLVRSATVERAEIPARPLPPEPKPSLKSRILQRAATKIPCLRRFTKKKKLPKTQKEIRKELAETAKLDLAKAETDKLKDEVDMVEKEMARLKVLRKRRLGEHKDALASATRRLREARRKHEGHDLRSVLEKAKKYQEDVDKNDSDSS